MKLHLCRRRASLQPAIVLRREASRAVRALLRFCLIASGILVATSAWGAGEKIIFGWSAISGAQAVPWITKEAGLFEKHGLDATLLYLDGGSKAIQTLLSGEVPVVLGAGNSAVAAPVRGGDVVLIAGIYVYKTQRDFSKRVIAKYMRINDADAIDESYQFFSRLVLAKPYVPVNAIKEV